MAALNDLLEFQVKNTRDLLEVLQLEQHAITARNSAEIESIAQKKSQLVTQIQTTDQRIAAHPDLEQLSQSDAFDAQVTTVRNIMQECQTVNQLNGEALQRANVSYTKLNNLLQQSHGKIGMTYNSGGLTHTSSTLGTKVKA
jgi:flagella synthesis protein FlgN